MPMSPHRPALAAILVAVVAVLSAAFATLTPASAAPSPSNPIVARALLDLGTWQGECWMWMKEVVLDATGKEIGFDYRDGYLEAGAREVSLNEAGPGDIIQIADDDWTAPDADYPGLHTAIIISANGDGTFEAVDSNQNYDGMVALRSSYDPARITAARGLNFHIYRVTGEPAKPVASFTVVPGPLATGDKARVNTPGECLNLRSGPGGSRIACLPHNAQVSITGSPKVVDGTKWVPVGTSAGGGWMAADFLLKEVPTASPSGAGNVKPVMPYRAVVSIASD